MFLISISCELEGSVWSSAFRRWIFIIEILFMMSVSILSGVCLLCVKVFFVGVYLRWLFGCACWFL